MDILDDMGVSKLSAKVFSKVNYSFKLICILIFYLHAMHTLNQSKNFNNYDFLKCF